MSDWKKHFSRVDEDLKRVVIISSLHGSGKTHWAVEESPKPHYIIETEGNHNLHTAKNVDPDIFKCQILSDPKDRPSQNWFSGRNDMWQQVEDAVLSILNNDAPEGTVILDSGSDLMPMIISQLSVDWNRGDMAFPPRLYGQVYGVLGTLISNLRQRHNVIMTVKMKDEWKGKGDNAVKTGNTTMSIWNNAVYLAEDIIEIQMRGEKRIFKVRPNKKPPVIVDSISWDELVNGISHDKIERSKIQELRSGLEKIYDAFSSKGWSVGATYPGTIKELKERTSYLKDLYKKNLQEEKEAKRTKRRTPPKPQQKTQEV